MFIGRRNAKWFQYNMKEIDEKEKQLALYQFQIEMDKGERSILEEGTISNEDFRKELEI